jgi:hypothetical protein
LNEFAEMKNKYCYLAEMIDDRPLPLPRMNAIAIIKINLEEGLDARELAVLGHVAVIEGKDLNQVVLDALREKAARHRAGVPALPLVPLVPGA